MVLIGGATGIFIVSLMSLLSLALSQGPAGLTFAFLNSGAIGAPVLLGLVFKKGFGFDLALWSGIGMFFVLVGLFWAALHQKMRAFSKKWLLWAFTTFLFQVIILSLFQWRVMLTNDTLPLHICLPFHCKEAEGFWFMPVMFFFAFLIQGTIFFTKEKRFFKKAEWLGGSLGGVANGMSTWLLLLASSVASNREKSMLLPFFAVAVILLCNLFGKILYKESIHWWATSCCTCGIAIGALSKII